MDNIQERDTQHGLKQAWHGKTIIPDDGILRKDRVFNYEIIEEQVHIQGKPYGDFFVPVCSDDLLPVGKGSVLNRKTYSLVSPKEVYEMLDVMMEGTNHKIVSAGSVSNRGRFFISMELEELKGIKVGDREFFFYLNALSSMDKSLPLTFTNTSICTVCENTLLANFRSDSWFKHKFRHTKNLRNYLEDFKVLLEETFGMPAIFQAEMEKLGEIKVSNELAGDVFKGLFVSDKDLKETEFSKGKSTRLSNRVEEHLALFNRGLGNKGENGLDVLSALTQAMTRTDDPKKVSKLLSKEYDTSDQGNLVKKAEFANRLTQENAFKTLSERGKMASGKITV